MEEISQKFFFRIFSRSFFIFLCFFSLSAFPWDNFCLSQTDLLLLSRGRGKNPSSARKKEIKRLRKKLQAMEGSRGALERTKEKIRKITDNLANTLSEKVRMDGDEAAEKIVLYMEGKERNWEFDNCPLPPQVARPSPAPPGTAGSSSDRPVSAGGGQTTSPRVKQPDQSKGVTVRPSPERNEGASTAKEEKHANRPNSQVGEKSKTSQKNQDPQEEGDSDDPPITIIEDMSLPQKPASDKALSATKPSKPVKKQIKRLTPVKPQPGPVQKPSATKPSKPVKKQIKRLTPVKPQPGPVQKPSATKPSKPVKKQIKRLTPVKPQPGPVQKPSATKPSKPVKKQIKRLTPVKPQPSQPLKKTSPSQSQSKKEKLREEPKPDSPKSDEKKKKEESRLDPEKPKQKENNKKLEEEETFNPSDWFFVPDSSYNNRTNPFPDPLKKDLPFLYRAGLSSGVCFEEIPAFAGIPSSERRRNNWETMKLQLNLQNSNRINMKMNIVKKSKTLNRPSVSSLPVLISEFFHLFFPVAQAAEVCAPWQNPPLSRRFFKSNGRIRAKAFCKAYAHDPRECRDQLEALRKALDRVQKADNNIQKLEARLSDLEREQEDEEFDRTISDEEETEARGLCVECLSDIRGALAPSGWQRFGSGLSVALGLGLSVMGVREARRSQTGVNQLLALQGLPAENYGANSLLGAWMGVPWIAQGLGGLSRDIAPEYVCSPRFYNNPYAYNPYRY